jgi:DNA invertase Pin-like site-specific DNA recombinase
VLTIIEQTGRDDYSGVRRLTQPTITAAIYARVSTKDQQYEMQLHDLRAYAKRMGWQSVEFLEKESSVKKRPVFDSMLTAAREGRVGVILVWRIDRFARSMKDYVNTTLDLYRWKVRLISTTENVDTGDDNPFAEFQRGLLALLAQLERRIIVARVNAGIAEAKRQGKHCGRPKRIFSIDEALRLQRQGHGLRAIAGKLGVNFATVSRRLAGVAKPSLK